MDKKLQEIKHHFEIVLAHFDLEKWQQDFVSHLKLHSKYSIMGF